MSDVERQRPAWMIAVGRIWRYELTGELDDDDEIVDIFSNDITELDQERREANTL